MNSRWKCKLPSIRFPQPVWGMSRWAALHQVGTPSRPPPPGFKVSLCLPLGCALVVLLGCWLCLHLCVLLVTQCKQRSPRVQAHQIPLPLKLEKQNTTNPRSTGGCKTHYFRFYPLFRLARSCQIWSARNYVEPRLTTPPLL